MAPLTPTAGAGAGAAGAAGLASNTSVITTVAAPSDRPRLAHRQSSTSSQVSQTASEASSSHSHSHSHSNLAHHNHQHHHSRQHKAGRHHGRLGARNTSFGHNLNKLAHGHGSTTKMPHDGTAHHANTSAPGTPTTAAVTNPTAAASYARPPHTRSKSGESSGPDASVPASPRPPQHPHVKRNASAFVISRNHSHTALKKTHSSGHLPRTASAKGLTKATQSRAPTAKRKHSGRSDRSDRSMPASPVSPIPQQQPTVRFALADEEPDSDDANDVNADEENEWTEESASVSPNVTRTHTRQNSVVLDPDIMAKEPDHPLHDVTSGDESTTTVIHAPDGATAEAMQESPTGYDHTVTRSNGESAHQPSIRQSALDADVITSRLLQRKVTPAHGASPQVSSVSAIVQPDANDHRSLSHSQASTLADGTPGRDLVSRFVNANSAEGTPRDGNLLPRTSSPLKDSSELDASKRNKSAPNMAVDRGPISPTTPKSKRSGPDPPSDLPLSRTQQKLLLQRASSAIEPQKHIPAVLPRPGAAQLLGHGLSLASTDGSTPAQLQALFAQINKEYNVVRRYRNPVADAAARAREIPHPERRTQARRSSRRTGEEGGVPLDGRESPVGSFRGHGEQHSHHDERMRQARHSQHQDDRRTTPKRDDRGHRSRVSFDLPSVKTDDTDDEGAGATARPGGTRRDEAYELCRRMWEMETERTVPEQITPSDSPGPDFIDTRRHRLPRGGQSLASQVPRSSLRVQAQHRAASQRIAESCALRPRLQTLDGNADNADNADDDARPLFALIFDKAKQSPET